MALTLMNGPGSLVRDDKGWVVTLMKVVNVPTIATRVRAQEPVLRGSYAT